MTSEGPRKRYAVVVPVHEAGDGLLELLRSLDQEVGPEGHVVLSDDGSSDTAIERARTVRWSFELTVVDHPISTGAGAARNRGVAATTADVLVFVDADDLVEGGFVTAILAPLESDEADLVAASRDFESLNTHLPAAAAALRGSAPAPAELEQGDGRVVSGGSGMAVSRDLFDRLRGFDERLLRRQDQDFWLRAQDLGARVRHVERAVVSVRLRESVSDQLAQAARGAKWSAVFYALHPELRGSHSEWRRGTNLWWVVLRLPYLVWPARRTVLLGGVARLCGRVQGTAHVRRLRRDGQLVPWQHAR